MGPTASAPTPANVTSSAGLQAAIDPTPFLRESPPTSLRGWVVPRGAWLDVGESSAPPDGDAPEPVEVMIVERGATLVRIAFHTTQLKFVAWVRRADLLGVLARNVEIRSDFAPPARAIGATLYRGARVEVLERKAERVRVRYSGALELETWIAKDALVEQAEPLEASGPAFIGGVLFHAIPGLAIRSEPRWGSDLVAVLARTYFLEDLGIVDDAWNEVSYTDHALKVHGFASRREPPTRLRLPIHPHATATPFAGKDILTAGACLYASPKGEAVGVAGPVPAIIIADERDGWWSVTLDTPWGPIRFAARRDRGAWLPCERTSLATGAGACDRGSAPVTADVCCVC
jgi:hypothetical protein